MSHSRISNPIVALCLAGFATFLAWSLFSFATLKPLENRFYDIGLTQRSAKAPDDIVILGIDERFMKGRHAYIAPRDRLAKLLRIVASGKPRAIALDVWFDSRLDDGPQGVDAQLRSALISARNNGVPVILSDLPPSELDVADDSKSGQTAHGSVIPFFKAAAQTGSVLFTPDGSSGAIRWHSKEDPRVVPSLALQMARLAGAKNLPMARLQHEGAPLDFCGPPKTIARQSAADFLENPILAPLVENQLVFIGATYPRSRDLLPTPYSLNNGVQMYGVELLAQATDSLRRGAPRHSHQSSSAHLFDFALVFLAAILVALAALRGTLPGILTTFIFCALAITVAILSARDVSALWGFRYHNATPFLIALPFAASGGIAWRSLIQARELKLVRDTFGAYVGSEVLEALGGKMPELGGETRAIAVLFCDIRGYSALAETMADNPRGLLDELNGHFAPLVAALQKRGAYVDNYVGDLVMALFGAPVSQGKFETDVRAAVFAALDFLRLVNERNKTRRQNGQIPIEIGIGVHCGEAVVGNLGSTDSENGGKIHYTAIGDVVNVASRLESATRGQNVDLLVTREVVEACGQAEGLPTWNQIGFIQVKGRTAPVEIFGVRLTTD